MWNFENSVFSGFTKAVRNISDKERETCILHAHRQTIQKIWYFTHILLWSDDRNDTP